MAKRDFSEARKNLASAFIKNIQLSLCIPAADATGVLGPATTTAIRGYLQGLPHKVPPDPIDPTSANLRPLMQAAIDDVPSCTAGKFKSAFEVGRYGVPGDRREARIKTLQLKIGTSSRARVPP